MIKLIICIFYTIALFFLSMAFWIFDIGSVYILCMLLLFSNMILLFESIRTLINQIYEGLCGH